MLMKQHNVVRSGTAVIFMAAVILLPRIAESASLQNRPSNGCSERVAKAQEKYILGLFQEALELVSPCLEKSDLPAAETVAAYRLLGLIYIAEDSLSAAREALQTLLTLEPQFQPDPDQDPPPFTKLVEDLRQEMVRETEKTPATTLAGGTEYPAEQPREESAALKNNSKKWMFLGAGILVATGTLALLVSGGGGDEGMPPGSNDLPVPPDLP